MEGACIDFIGFTSFQYYRKRLIHIDDRYHIVFALKFYHNLSLKCPRKCEYAYKNLKNKHSRPKKTCFLG